MYELDITDKKILYALGENARQSYEDIARHIRSKKPVVAYHIQRLQEQVVWKYVPVISLSRLGIYAFKLYVRLHGMEKQQQEEFLKALVANPQVNWVAQAVGNWDVLISFYASNVLEFARHKNTLLEQYGKFIEEYAITILEDALVFNRDYLVKGKSRNEYIFGGQPTIEALDDEEKAILRAISNDGRFKAIAIAQKLDLDVRTVMAKIKTLEKRGIIQGYTVFLNLEVLNLRLYKLCVYLENFSNAEYERLISFCKMEERVIHIIKSLGAWELEVEMECAAPPHEFIGALKTQFPHLIRKVELVTITKEHKLEFFPTWY